MISYVEDVIKIWEGLVHVITYDAYKQGDAGEDRILDKSPSHNIAQYVTFTGLFLK